MYHCKKSDESPKSGVRPERSIRANRPREDQQGHNREANPLEQNFWLLPSFGLMHSKYNRQNGERRTYGNVEQEIP